MNSLSAPWRISCTKSLKEYLRDSIEIQNLDLDSNIDDKNHKKKRHSNSLDIAEVHCSQHHQIIETRDKHFSVSENKLQTIMKREINIYVNENAMKDDKELLEIDDKKEMQGEKEETKRVVPHFIQWQAPIVEWLSPIKDWQAPISEYQESLLEWYVPYGVTDLGDGDGLGE